LSSAATTGARRRASAEGRAATEKRQECVKKKLLQFAGGLPSAGQKYDTDAHIYLFFFSKSIYPKLRCQLERWARDGGSRDIFPGLRERDTNVERNNNDIMTCMSSSLPTLNFIDPHPLTPSRIRLCSLMDIDTVARPAPLQLVTDVANYEREIGEQGLLSRFVLGID
jgi:hypothetical protein